MLRTDDIISLAIESLMLILQGSLPAIIAAAVVGVVVALIQALTQIQDQGLPTAFKFFAVMLAIFVTYGAVASSLSVFTIQIFDMIRRI